MKKRRQNKKGISFIEVMLAMVILSGGLVAIFKTFLISLDRINYLTHRLYASNSIDNRLLLIERALRARHVLPFEMEHVERVNMGSHVVDFRESLFLSAVDGLDHIFACDCIFSWDQRGETKKISRSTFLFNQNNE